MPINACRKACKLPGENISRPKGFHLQGRWILETLNSPPRSHLYSNINLQAPRVLIRKIRSPPASPEIWGQGASPTPEVLPGETERGERDRGTLIDGEDSGICANRKNIWNIETNAYLYSTESTEFRQLSLRGSSHPSNQEKWEKAYLKETPNKIRKSLGGVQCCCLHSGLL